MISPQLCPPQMDVQTLLVRQCVLLFTDCSKRQNATPSGKGNCPLPRLLLAVLTLFTVHLRLKSGTFASVVPCVNNSGERWLSHHSEYMALKWHLQDVHHRHAWCLQRPEEGARCLEP